jgi:plastocyanin
MRHPAKGAKAMMRTLAAPLAALALSAASPARANEIVVKIENFTFEPAEITVKPGTTITWENDDDIPHSIVADNAKFHSKALDTGEKYSMTLADAGGVSYFCGLHPHMKGKISVVP